MLRDRMKRNTWPGLGGSKAKGFGLAVAAATKGTRDKTKGTKGPANLGLPSHAADLREARLAEWTDGLRLCQVVESLKYKV